MLSSFIIGENRIAFAGLHVLIRVLSEVHSLCVAGCFTGSSFRWYQVCSANNESKDGMITTPHEKPTDSKKSEPESNSLAIGGFEWIYECEFFLVKWIYEFLELKIQRSKYWTELCYFDRYVLLIFPIFFLPQVSHTNWTCSSNNSP